ncbi:hypothetical protein Q4519_13790 [Motilimonas sp. 1_MG-2023]|uniref:hypothetical protein n=1 Tax=Motilimonas sp. 1_MG-2023 TaxID=3062672 RepID=UPI0026E2A3A8|nr:hypothetical protein [Motilimonas sp. 1_MG-2023]MDO6526758.1 hypothetical protein [Motilimonas sp. 1_MG-2023]
MGKRYRRRRSNSIASVIPDIVHVASRLSWWGALLTGIIAYFLIAILLGGYIEGHIASQAESKFYVIIEARFGRLVHVCNWVGIAGFLVGVFFAIRNYFVLSRATSNEKGIVAFLSKLVSRSVD